MSDSPLESRFLDNLRDLGVGDSPARLVVAFSGGLDSTVLLHLLNVQAPTLRLTVTVAHFDHRMRPDSAEDADWAAEIARSMGLDFELGMASRPLRAETEAREARYAFLFQVAEKLDAAKIATAHHADDQAETVLFRILRGTGVAGLGGIPRRTRAGVVRPLLPFWREELEAYAHEHGLHWRDDPTNAQLGPARNWIRLELLPTIERTAPNVKRNLVRLADLARESEAGLREVVREAERASVRQDGGALVLVRSRLAEYHPAVATRVLRSVLRQFGVVLGRVGTRSLLQFITDAPSGRERHLPAGVRFRLEFDHARVERVAAPADPDRPVTVPGLEPGRELTARLSLGGREYRVVVRDGAAQDQEADRDAIWRSRIPLSASRFPLLLRSRRPGDQVCTAGGTKSLKKLMIERRVPRGERASRPVLADAEGVVVWVAGVGTFADPPERQDRLLNLAVYDD